MDRHGYDFVRLSNFTSAYHFECSEKSIHYEEISTFRFLKICCHSEWSGAEWGISMLNETDLLNRFLIRQGGFGMTCWRNLTTSNEYWIIYPGNQAMFRCNQIKCHVIQWIRWAIRIKGHVIIIPCHVIIIRCHVIRMTCRIIIIPCCVFIIPRRVILIPCRINIIPRHIILIPRRVSIIPCHVFIIPRRVCLIRRHVILSTLHFNRIESGVTWKDWHSIELVS